jgi:hypothetical protein
MAEAERRVRDMITAAMYEFAFANDISVSAIDDDELYEMFTEWLVESYGKHMRLLVEPGEVVVAQLRTINIAQEALCASALANK